MRARRNRTTTYRGPRRIEARQNGGLNAGWIVLILIFLVIFGGDLWLTFK